VRAPLPENERERLEALRALHVLDTPPEQEFDDLVAIAAEVCAAPISTVTVIDADRQWHKAHIGPVRVQEPREVSFCAHTILGDDLVEIRDAAADPRFADNPLVLGEPRIRFYAGVPLRSREGHAVGTLCVLDREPRELTGTPA